MDEKDNSRSSLQTAADLGRAAKAVYRIAQAAAVSGVHGAAAAAVKETVPALVKFLLAVLLIMIVIPMVVFTALPNIFFGYDSSNTASVIHMTEQAMRIGGAYMRLDDFERTQIDSIVTGIAAEYEADGTAIDHIEVKNTMKEDDLLWIIAINSAAYEQDLDAMSAELIQNFCRSTLSYQPSLSLLGGSTSATLEVEIKRIDPEELMEQMGFNEDARQWAGALFETLKDSGALEKYGGYFSAYQPDYSGDGSYSGDIQHGTSYDMVIRKKGSVFFIDGKEFKIGGGVFANDESEYMGLYGTVTEIRTDEDRETENDTPDIYCEFMSPDSVAMAAELETRFSDLYRQDMQLEEISLDCVIMSPEMLEPVPAREPESIGNQLTLTCLEDQIDHVDGVTLAISNDMGVLLRKMLENLEEYDDPPVLTRVEKTISGFLFAYGGRDNQEDGPCVVYIVSETPVLPAKNKEEMK